MTLTTQGTRIGLGRELKPRRTLGPAYGDYVSWQQRVSGQLVPLAFPIHLHSSKINDVLQPNKPTSVPAPGAEDLLECTTAFYMCFTFPLN